MELKTAAVADRVSYTEALLGSCVSINPFLHRWICYGYGQRPIEDMVPHAIAFKCYLFDTPRLCCTD